MRIEKFQDFIKYKFKNQNLLLQALTTPMYGNEQGIPNYDILETLGDAVIKLIFSLKLYNSGIRDPDQLTKMKQCLENNKTFLEIASEMELEKYIYSSNSQQIEGTTILADVFESICGAIYIDSENNLLTVEEIIINKFIHDWKIFLERPLTFSKNQLLEFLQEKFKFTPKIKYTSKKIGPDHALEWILESPIILDPNNKEIIRLPSALKSDIFKTKKEAEKDLSLKILRYLKELNI